MVIIPELRISLKKDGEGYLVEWYFGLKEHGTKYADTLDKARLEAYDIISRYQAISA